MKFRLLQLFLVPIFLFSCSEKNEVKPEIKDIKELVFASGELQWQDGYNLIAQTDGVLSKVNFDIGNEVKKGEVIAQIDNENNQINVKSAKEQLAISNENLKASSPALQQLSQNIRFAEAKYKQDEQQAARYLRLYQSQSVAKVEYENMALAAKNSLAQLKALQDQYNQILQQAKSQQITTNNQLQNSKVQLDFNKLTIPQNGKIIKKLKENGDYVRKGDIVAVIANSSDVQALLNVDEKSISKIKIGQQVFVKLNTNKDVTHTAKITEILSAFDQQSQSFLCKAVFEKPLQQALYGTQLEANIFIGEKKNALLIPRSYLGFGNKVKVKGKQEDVIIKPGIISSDYVEVLSDINKNDVLLPLNP